MTLPTCPREDCTSASPHHDHNRWTGEVRDHTEAAECAHWELSNYTQCYASRLGSTAAHSKLEAPRVGTPIDPDDVRVGDRVRVEYSATIDVKPQPDGKNWVGHDFADRRFYLLDRPDPLAPLVATIREALADASILDDRNAAARAIAEAIATSYEVAPKAVQS